MKELSSGVKYALPAVSADIDLSVLTQVLVPQSAVREAPDQWSRDGLLQDVQHELLQQQDEGAEKSA